MEEERSKLEIGQGDTHTNPDGIAVVDHRDRKNDGRLRSGLVQGSAARHIC